MRRNVRRTARLDVPEEKAPSPCREKHLSTPTAHQTDVMCFGNGMFDRVCRACGRVSLRHQPVHTGAVSPLPDEAERRVTVLG